MIGVYDYTVIATYLSLLLGLAGIYSAAQNAPLAAMLYLMLAGLLDAFDGRIARTKANRTDSAFRSTRSMTSSASACCPPPSAGARAARTSGSWPPCRFLRSVRSFASPASTWQRKSGREKPRKTAAATSACRSSALAAPLFYLAAQYFRLNCAAVYAPGLFLLGVLYITPLRVKKPHLGGILLLAALGLAEFVALVCVLTR